MLQFAYCPQRDGKKVVEIHQEADTPAISASNEMTEKTFVPIAAPSNSVDNVSIDLDLIRHIDDFNKIPQTNNFNQGKTSSDQLDISYAHILPALEMSIKSMEMEILVDDDKGKTNNNVKCAAIDLELRKNQIETLWNRYRNIFPQEYTHMWSSLDQGLADYLTHLKKRFQLHMECDKLRRQNAQLKYMLQELL